MLNNQAIQFLTTRRLVMVLCCVVVLFLAFYNLTAFPQTWFDEGSHLHVPKTLVRFGVYADYSSEGFRYFGPTVGVGPTVMLPIAAMLKIFGVGLTQARVVMALYLLATIYLFFRLARTLGDERFALVATALLVTSRGVALLEYGRQLLGEVPGFCFLVAALGLWFSVWDRATWKRLTVIGILFGLGMITKYQYLLVVAPALVLAWLANWFYYRVAPHRIFLIPGIVAAMCFAAWQIYAIVYLGPATALENFAQLRETAAGAAAVFSLDLMRRSLVELASPKVFLLALLPALVYGAIVSAPRTRAGQQWGVLYLFVGANLIWYVFASISWLRYAFLGLAVTCLLVARLFFDVTREFDWNWATVARIIRSHSASAWREGARVLMFAWLALMIAVPLAQTTRDIVMPPFNSPLEMARYLDNNVPQDILIETWEPEMGFLTSHLYHFPPASLLPKAVSFIWLNQPPPAQYYDFVQMQSPPYILVGGFARWVSLYGSELLDANYVLVTRIGTYELYRRAR